MLAARVCWRDIGNHSRFAISCEGVFQDLGQLAPSERQVLFFEVQGSNAFLKCEKRLVYLCTVKPSLFILVNSVSPPFTSCQVDKAHFSLELLVTSALQLKLKNSMRSRTVSIGPSHTASPTLKA